MDTKRIIVVDDNDNEIEMEILFTFRDEEKFKKDYVLYVNPDDETGAVFASAYTDSGELLEITDEDEWAMIEEVFEAFTIKHEDEFEA